ncbi:MAG TPA: hypothetical protein VMD53_04145 [Rhizomicrobium sp.]|nr:hypothetical protein [Rhizomicrobium sp.]
MNKLPVGETISGAYGFAFADFLSVLGVAWLPHVIYVLLIVGIVYGLAPELPGQVMRGEFDISMLYTLRRIGGLIWLVGLVIQSMVTVGLQKKALGEMPGPTFFYFSLGAPVWRMIGATFLAILAYIFIVVLTVGVTVALALAATKFVAHFGAAIAVILGIVASFWLIYTAVRLFFFLPAVVVAEEQIGLVRSWELGGGNFWRIFAVVFVVFVPVAIGFGIIENALIGPFLPADLMTHLHPGMTADQLGNFYMLIVKETFQSMRGALPLIVALVVIRSIVFLGLGNGAVAKGYLGVTDKG